MSTSTLKIGSKVPEFNLKGVDGKEYSPDSFKDQKVFIVIFSCNHCPYVRAYEERIKSIQSEYMEKGVQVVAINSNDDSRYAEDSYEEMIKRAEERKFNFPYLRDEDQIAAKAFDASHTPEIFLFDEERKLRYHGKIDDNWQFPEKVKNTFLKNALDEILSSREISIPETFSIGCTIKWKDVS
jgi:peroxiredoxin